MMHFLRQIYRRWLIQYQWANIVARVVNQVCFGYGRLTVYLKLKLFRHWMAHKLLNSVSELEPINNTSTELQFLENVRVVGHSRFILKKKNAAYDSTHPDFHLKDIYTAYCFLEESQGLMLYHSRRASCYFQGLSLQTRLDGTWLSIMSGASENWMHWLSESIPRLAGVLTAMKHEKFGLLIDQELPRNMLEVLDIFAAGMPRLEVWHRHFVEVERLIVPALPAGMCIAWPRPSYFDSAASRHAHSINFCKSGIYHFDSNGLMFTRKTILEHFDIQPRKTRKIFILRKSYFRHMTNQSHIEKILLERGFESVSPGELNVEAQVKLFSEAAIIVAQGGAALANIMFAPAGCAVICIAVQNEYVNYNYFPDYAKVFGVSIEYVIGKIDAPGKYNAAHVGLVSHPMNAEFSCPENELARVLERMHSV